MLEEGVKAGKVPALTRTSRNWFRDLAKNKRSVTPQKIFSTAPKAQFTRFPQIGFMYHFFYNPKTKDKLPYYDTFPLIFPLQDVFNRKRATRGGKFYGINLHYLHPRLRARLMDALYTVTTDRNYDEETRVKAGFKLLNRASKFRFFKPCVKSYLMTNVRGRLVKINANAWDLALFLPTERFRKATKQKVFRESRKQIGV
tara:strand:+ start:2940 stop:3539 length:600 start_codon:yes stop_codon:yes gene_type:complete